MPNTPVTLPVANNPPISDIPMININAGSDLSRSSFGGSLNETIVSNIPFSPDIDSVAHNTNDLSVVTSDVSVDPPGGNIRQSTRSRSIHAHLKVYECALPPSLQHSINYVYSNDIETNSAGKLYPISNHLSINQLCHEYDCFTASITQIDEPKTYKEVIKHTE